MDYQEYYLGPLCKLRNWVRLLTSKEDVFRYALSENPNAIHFLEQNVGYINWNMLSKNPNAIHLLENNPKKN